MSLHSRDFDATRLQQLSGEIGRIATILDRLSAAPYGPGEGSTQAPQTVPAEAVAAMIRRRRLRSRFFEDQLFADPAWDILLDLFHAELLNRRISVSSACIAANVPATTALRWTKLLVAHGLIVRRSDPLDGRRVFVELTPETSAKLREYFAETVLVTEREFSVRLAGAHNICE